MVEELTDDSPLHAAGVRVGDAVLSINGQPAFGAVACSELCRNAAVGDIFFMLARSSLGKRVRHVCATRCADTFGIEVVSESSPVSGDMAPTVVNLTAASVLAGAGLCVGDTVLAVNGMPATNATEVSRLLREVPADSQVIA